MSKEQFIHLYAETVQTATGFFASLIRPVNFASMAEAITIAALGCFLLLTCAVISWRGRREPAFEREWTERRLQLTGVFGTVALVLAFVRYEGIPYVSMQGVFGIIILWAVISLVQLVLYRRLVLKPARVAWNERKTHDQYLPQPKHRSKR